MTNFKNEKGAALVLTLMIITLFLIFILALFTQITNTTKQVTTMEKQIDARLVAEMGIDYYHSLTENIVLEESITDPVKIKSRLLNSTEKELDTSHSFSLSNIEVNEEYDSTAVRNRSRDWETYDNDDEDDDDKDDDEGEGDDCDDSNDKDEDEDDEDEDEDDEDDKDDCGDDSNESMPKLKKITISFTSTGISHEKEVSIENNTITINFEND